MPARPRSAARSLLRRFVTHWVSRSACSSLRGKPLVISLIYTSCHHVCPLITRNLEKTVAVARDALGDDAFAVVTIGFDWPVDTPEQMRVYASSRGIDAKQLVFSQRRCGGDRRDQRGCRLSLRRQRKGFDHLSQTTIVDGDGQVYRQVYGQDFDTPALVEPLKELVFNTPREAGLIAHWVDTLRFFCTVYDPEQRSLPVRLFDFHDDRHRHPVSRRDPDIHRLRVAARGLKRGIRMPVRARRGHLRMGLRPAPQPVHLPRRARLVLLLDRGRIRRLPVPVFRHRHHQCLRVGRVHDARAMVRGRRHAQPASLCFGCAGRGRGAAPVARVRAGPAARQALFRLADRRAAALVHLRLRHQRATGWSGTSSRSTSPLRRPSGSTLCRCSANRSPTTFSTAAR